MERKTTAGYRSSWVDGLSSWIIGFPGKPIMYYLFIGIILLAIQTGFYWYEDPVQVGVFLPPLCFFPLLFPTS
jgi:hypothetical protein